MRKKKFDASLKDIEFWLGVVESQLQSNDLGRDLTSVQSLLKKNDAIEADIATHEEQLNELNNTADKNDIKLNADLDSINNRYQAVKIACAEGKSRLTDSYNLFQVPF